VALWQAWPSSHLSVRADATADAAAPSARVCVLGLRVASRYRARVRAVNRVGVSEFSPSVEINTRARVPLKPAAPAAQCCGYDAEVAVFAPACDGGRPIFQCEPPAQLNAIASQRVTTRCNAQVRGAELRARRRLARRADRRRRQVCT
jgi:hypothetical protein